jgi:hypothetical protein
MMAPVPMSARRQRRRLHFLILASQHSFDVIEASVDLLPEVAEDDLLARVRFASAAKARPGVPTRTLPATPRRSPADILCGP